MHQLRFKLIIAVFMLVASFVSYAQKSYTYQQPQEQSDGWPTKNLISDSVDVSLIEKLINQLATGKHRMDSTILIIGGDLVFEHYFGSFKMDQQHDLRSVTKSIRALLVGIAIDKGYIDSIEDPIFKYLKSHQVKKNKHPAKQQITIKHLLTMSTGLECNDWDKKSKGQEDKVYKKKDWIQYTLDLPVKNEPGAVAYYCSMGAILVAEVIEQASGMGIDAFAKKYLFKPLGISNYSWGHTSKKKSILSSGKRLYMTTRDLAKLGQLVLQGGQWQGTQLISKMWIEQATTAQVKLAQLDYGFFWWNIPFHVGGNQYNIKTATGNGGQYIFVSPELNMVAVFTGSAYNSEEDKLPFAIIKDVFLPTLLETKHH